MVSDMCRNTTLDIVCFVETKLTNPTSSTLNELGSRFNFVVKNVVGASGGIMIGVDRIILRLRSPDTVTLPYL